MLDTCFQGLLFIFFHYVFLQLRDFKTMKCSIKKSHDWKLCSSYHKGDIDRRRNPYEVTYMQNQSENTVEKLYHPSLFRTSLCVNGSGCKWRDFCSHAHSKEELRVKKDILYPPPGHKEGKGTANDDGQQAELNTLSHRLLSSTSMSVLSGASAYPSPSPSPSPDRDEGHTDSPTRDRATNTTAVSKKPDKGVTGILIAPGTMSASMSSAPTARIDAQLATAKLWSCNACSNINHSKRTDCEICLTPLPHAEDNDNPVQISSCSQEFRQQKQQQQPQLLVKVETPFELTPLHAFFVRQSNSPVLQSLQYLGLSVHVSIFLSEQDARKLSMIGYEADLAKLPESILVQAIETVLGSSAFYSCTLVVPNTKVKRSIQQRIERESIKILLPRHSPADAIEQVFVDFEHPLKAKEECKDGANAGLSIVVIAQSDHKSLVDHCLASLKGLVHQEENQVNLSDFLSRHLARLRSRLLFLQKEGLASSVDGSLLLSAQVDKIVEEGLLAICKELHECHIDPSILFE
jgi:hypothetical protein